MGHSVQTNECQIPPQPETRGIRDVQDDCVADAELPPSVKEQRFPHCLAAKDYARRRLVLLQHTG